MRKAKQRFIENLNKDVKKSQATLVAFFLQAMSGSLPPALGQRELNQEDRRASPICLPIRASP